MFVQEPISRQFEEALEVFKKVGGKNTKEREPLGQYCEVATTWKQRELAELMTVCSKTHCVQSDDHSHFILRVMAMWKRLNMCNTYARETTFMKPIFDAALLNFYNQCRAKKKTDWEMIAEVTPVLSIMVEHVEYFDQVCKAKLFSDVVPQIQYLCAHLAFAKKIWSKSLNQTGIEYMIRYAKYVYAKVAEADLGEITVDFLANCKGQIMNECSERGFSKMMTVRQELDAEYRGVDGAGRVFKMEDICDVLQGVTIQSVGFDKGITPLIFEQDIGFLRSTSNGTLPLDVCAPYNSVRDSVNALLAKETWSSLDDLMNLLKENSGLWASDKSFQAVIMAIRQLGGDHGTVALSNAFIEQMPTETKLKDIATALTDLRAVTKTKLWNWVPTVVQLQGEEFIDLMDRISRGVFDGNRLEFEKSRFFTAVWAYVQYFVHAIPKGDAFVGGAGLFGEEAFPVLINDMESEVAKGNQEDPEHIAQLYKFVKLYGKEGDLDKLDNLKTKNDGLIANKGKGKGKGAKVVDKDFKIVAPTLAYEAKKAAGKKKKVVGGASSSSVAFAVPLAKKTKLSFLLD